MITNLKPYPRMKDSGVEWSGEVPEHWSQKRLKSIARLRYGLGQPPRELSDGLPLIRATNVDHGRIIQKNLAYIDPLDLPKSRNAFLSKNEIIVVRSGAYTADSAIIPEAFEGAVAGYDMVVTVTGARPEFIAAALLSRYVRDDQLIIASARSAQPHLNAEELGVAVFFLPPRPEQTVIVRFLDYADQRIRRYIRAKQKLITLLEEQKQAIIHQAVTGQIDVRTGQPYPAYKDSGLAWLGKVPEHWEARRLKTLCNMQSGDGITSSSIEPTGKYPVYGGNGLRGYTSNYTHEGHFALIGRQGALCGNVHIASGRFWASEHAIVVTVICGHDVDWFGATLDVMDLNQYSIAAAQPGLSVERVLNLHVAVPPPEEQAVIAAKIEQQTSCLDDSIHSVNDQIELFKEYRTRLIADVVTGQLDVRGTAARLSDKTEASQAMDRPDAHLLSTRT